MSPTVLVLTERRYCRQAQPRGLVVALRRRGANTLLVPDDRIGSHRQLRPSVVVARGRSRELLRALRAAEDAGFPVVNLAGAIEEVRDKFRMSAMLLAAGIPTPRTWSGCTAGLAHAIKRDSGTDPRPRFIVKPRFGDNGRGVTLVSDGRAIPPSDEPLVVQEYIENDGADTKLYVIGRQVWAVRKPSPLGTCRTRQLGPIPATHEHRGLALACGEAFGLSIYGVDCVESASGLAVIEVNDFPNFTHVPDADEHLAAEVLAGRR